MEKRGHKRKHLENIVAERLKRIRNEMFLINVGTSSEDSEVEKSDHEVKDKSDEEMADSSLNYEDDLFDGDSEEFAPVAAESDKTNNNENIDKDIDDNDETGLNLNCVIKQEPSNTKSIDTKSIERTILETGEHMYCPIIITEDDVALNIDEDGIEMVHVPYQTPDIVNLVSSDESDRENQEISVIPESVNLSDSNTDDERDDESSKTVDNSRNESSLNAENRILCERSKFRLETEKIAHYQIDKKIDNACEQTGKPISELDCSVNSFDSKGEASAELEKEISFGDLNSKLKIPEPLAMLGCTTDIQDEYLEQGRDVVTRSVISESENNCCGNANGISDSRQETCGIDSPELDIQENLKTKVGNEKKNYGGPLEKQGTNVDDQISQEFDDMVSKTDNKIYTDSIVSVKEVGKVDEKGDSATSIIRDDGSYADDTNLHMTSIKDKSKCFLERDDISIGGNDDLSHEIKYITENDYSAPVEQVGMSDKDTDIDSTILSKAEGETFKYLEETFIVISSSESEVEEPDDSTLRNKSTKKHSLEQQEVSDIDHGTESTVYEKDKESVICIDSSQSDNSFTSSEATINGSVMVVDEDTCLASEIKENSELNETTFCSSPYEFSGKADSNQEEKKFEKSNIIDYTDKFSITEANANLGNVDIMTEFSDTANLVSEQNINSYETSNFGNNSWEKYVSGDHDMGERNTIMCNCKDNLTEFSIIEDDTPTLTHINRVNAEYEQANLSVSYISDISVNRSDDSVCEGTESDGSETNSGKNQSYEINDHLHTERSMETIPPVTVSIIIGDMDEKSDKTNANTKDLRSLNITEEKAKRGEMPTALYDRLCRENEVQISLDIHNMDTEASSVKTFIPNGNTISVVSDETNFQDRNEVSESPVRDNNQNDKKSSFDENDKKDLHQDESEALGKLNENISDKKDIEALDSEYCCMGSNVNETCKRTNLGDTCGNETDNDKEKIEFDEDFDNDNILQIDPLEDIDTAFESPKSRPKKSTVLKLPLLTGDSMNSLKPEKRISKKKTKPSVLYSPIRYLSSDDELEENFGLVYQRKDDADEELMYWNEDEHDMDYDNNLHNQEKVKPSVWERLELQNDVPVWDRFKSSSSFTLAVTFKPSVPEINEGSVSNQPARETSTVQRVVVMKQKTLQGKGEFEETSGATIDFEDGQQHFKDMAIDHLTTSPEVALKVDSEQHTEEKTNLRARNSTDMSPLKELQLYDSKLEPDKTTEMSVCDPFVKTPQQCISSVRQNVNSKSQFDDGSEDGSDTGSKPDDATVSADLGLMSGPMSPTFRDHLRQRAGVNSKSQSGDGSEDGSDTGSKPDDATVSADLGNMSGLMSPTFRDHLCQRAGVNSKSQSGDESEDGSDTVSKPDDATDSTDLGNMSGLMSPTFRDHLRQRAGVNSKGQSGDESEDGSDTVSKPDDATDSTDLGNMSGLMSPTVEDNLPQRAGANPEQHHVLHGPGMPIPVRSFGPQAYRASKFPSVPFQQTLAPPNLYLIIPQKTEDIIGEFIPNKIPLADKMKWCNFLKCEQCGHECGNEDTMNEHFKCTMHRYASRHKLKYGDNFYRLENCLTNKIRPFDELVHVCPTPACEQVFLTRAECILHYQKDHGKLERIYCTAKIQKEELCRIRCFCSKLECSCCGKLLADGLQLNHHSQSFLHPLYNEYEGTFRIFVCYGCQEFFQTFVHAVDHKCLKENPSNIALRLLHVSKQLQEVHIE